MLGPELAAFVQDNFTRCRPSVEVECQRQQQGDEQYCRRYRQRHSCKHITEISSLG